MVDRPRVGGATNAGTRSRQQQHERTHLWVRKDVVEHVLNGTPKQQLSSRKRNRPTTRGGGEWGWMRAYTVLESTTPSSSPVKSSYNDNNDAGIDDDSGNSRPSPYGRARLRKVSSPATASLAKQQKQEAVAPKKQRQSLLSKQQITITIDDDEYAPAQLNGATLTLPPSNPGEGDGEGGEEPVVCMANSWWKATNSNDNGNAPPPPPQDLTSLTHLHEPSVVYCLSERYRQDFIYTYTGPILLALNPFRVCDGLYGHEVMHQYWNISSTTDSSQRPPPHIYATSNAAFSNMMRALNDNTTGDPDAAPVCGDQSILVSGESGAGKTVTTKIIMRYLATLSQARHEQRKSSSTPQTDESIVDDGGIESQVLQSNPILESFGNARTVRNDNSSRFGKFIEIQFSKSGCLLCASIETYLLEKVRLITQAPGERNYHIFYELLVGASPKEQRDLLIANCLVEDFRMLSSSGTYDRRDGVDDADTYRDLKNALKTVGFNTRRQMDLFTVTCALLHASNLTFCDLNNNNNFDDDSTSALDRSNPSLRATLSLMGVTVEDLEDALCRCTIEARGEKLAKNLSIPQANKALEALIKATYGALFAHIVGRVNASITVTNTNNGNEEEDLKSRLRRGATDGSRRQGRKKGETAYVGVLDIFGFESFDVNSFEQLCINYCNEALQQQFNKFVFKLEQEEYEKEGIEWSFISFPDNQDVLDLIEKKHTGVLSVLDEQCRLARCTDLSFARATYDKCSSHERFHATHTQKVNGQFSIHHYAGQVEYSTSLFLEKNKDELPKDLTDLLMSSSHALLPALAEILKSNGETSTTNSTATGGGSGADHGNSSSRSFKRSSSSLSRASVGGQFTSQLRQLRERIEQTSPHYVRCLKPNDDLVPNNFNPHIIADQLRCAGVLEAIRVSRVGFPQRFPHGAFLQRYRLLLSSRALNSLSHSRRREREDCDMLVKALAKLVIEELDHDGDADDDDNDERSSHTFGVQMGKTKVFLRQQSFDALEMLRGRKINAAAVKIQSAMRGFASWCRYMIIQDSTLRIQCFVRQVAAMQEYELRRRIQACIAIQCHWRRYSASIHLWTAGFIAYWGQRWFRGQRARRSCGHLLLEYKAKILQRQWRMYYAFSRYHWTRIYVIMIQCATRSFLARRAVRQLRRQARDLDAVAAERDRLKEEAKSLRLELEKARQTSNVQSSIGTPPKTPELEELLGLKAEVERLRNQVKTPPFVAPSEKASSDVGKEELESLANEMAKKDEELQRLKNEVEMLREERASDASIAMSYQRTSSRGPRSVQSMHRTTRGGGSDAGSTTSVRKMIARTRNRMSPSHHVDDERSISNRSGKASNFLSPINSFFRRGHNNETPLPPVESPCGKSVTSASLLDHEVASRFGEEDISVFDLDTSRNITIVGSRPGSQDLFGFPIFDAVREGSIPRLVETLRSCREIHKEINEGDNEGKTALHLSVSLCNVNVTKVLLEHHAVANAQDNEGNTPLHFAKTGPVVDALLELGHANPNIPNNEGVRPIHNAVRRRDLQAVKSLISHNADVNAADDTKWYTALHLIAQAEWLPEVVPPEIEDPSAEEIPVSVQILKVLCEGNEISRPDLSYQDNDGNTPLHHASILGSGDASDLMMIFLRGGADPTVGNQRGQTPLHLLCHNKALREFDSYHDTLRAMLAHGGDPNQTSLSGCTSLHLALYHQDIDSAVILIRKGAHLHAKWQKPGTWISFWDDRGSDQILPFDMVTDDETLLRIIGAIPQPQEAAPFRPWCMHCDKNLAHDETDASYSTCFHCGRLVCSTCARGNIDAEMFPKLFQSYIGETTKVCLSCDMVLISRKENCSETEPTTSFLEDDDDNPTF